MNIIKRILIVFGVVALLWSSSTVMYATTEEETTETTEATTENTSEATEESDTDYEMGKAYIKALYSSDIEISSNDIFVITYAVVGYSDVAKITVDASTITETTEIEMPVAEYFVDKIEYQGNNEKILTQGYGATLKFNSAPKGGSILYISIGTEKNDYLDETYAETYIIDDKHSAGPRVDAAEGRFDTLTEATTEYEYSTEDIDWDMEYDDNYGVEEQIHDTTQKPEVEHYQDITEESDEEEQVEEKKSGKGGLVFGIFLLVVAGGILWYINHKK